MKAIFIPDFFDPSKHLNTLNDALKDVTSIDLDIGTQSGRLLIVNNVTRKDKLEKINDISNETTDNNSI